MSLRSVWNLVYDTFYEWMEDGVSGLAAGLAFYTVFSLAPILVILLAIVGALYGEDEARTQILERSREMVGEKGTQIVASALEDANRSSGTATVVGILGVLIGATAVFVYLQESLNAIWGVAPKATSRVWPFLKKRLLSFVMILAFGAILLVSLVASTATAAVVEFASNQLPTAARYLEAVNFIVWLGIMTLAFGLVYRVLPDAKIAWTDVWVGAASAALLFSVGRTLLGVYLARSSVASTFGAASSLAILLLWIYYSAQILLLCGEFTQVWAKRRGTGIVPDEGAARIDKNYPKAA